MRRRLVLLMFLALSFAAIPSVTHAHAELASSQPAAGQRLGTAPGVVVLEFSEPLNAKLSRATVTDPVLRRFTGGVTSWGRFRIEESVMLLWIDRAFWPWVPP